MNKRPVLLLSGSITGLFCAQFTRPLFLRNLDYIATNVHLKEKHCT
jgi:hypothetical protein